MHETFIELVKERRGGKLADHPELFTGQFWTGKRGLELGLVDALGDLRSTIKQRFGKDAKLKLVTAPRGLLGRGLGFFGSALPASAAEIAGAGAAGLIDAVEDRALWGRYGL